MKLSKKQEYDFKDLLSKITDGTFTESEIEKLLIILRPISNKNSIVWELASFIAHQEQRTKGLFQERLDYSYLAIKNLSPINGTQEKINPLKINKKVFEILILGGLKFESKSVIKKRTGKSYEECIKLLKEHYKLSDGFYAPKDFNAISITLPIVSIPLSLFKVEDIFTEEKLKTDISFSIEKLCEVNGIQFDKAKLKVQLDDMIVCIICILQQREFKLFDNLLGTCGSVVLKSQNNNDYDFTIMGNIQLKRFNLSMPIFTFSGQMSKYMEYIPQNSSEWEAYNKNIFRTERCEDGNLKIKHYR